MCALKKNIVITNNHTNSTWIKPELLIFMTVMDKNFLNTFTEHSFWVWEPSQVQCVVPSKSLKNSLKVLECPSLTKGRTEPRDCTNNSEIKGTLDVISSDSQSVEYSVYALHVNKYLLYSVYGTTRFKKFEGKYLFAVTPKNR